nr:dihydrodipicolinate synthase family protein [Saccharopolyspora sp. ASAGF58]
MSAQVKPWHGVLVATALPLREGPCGKLEVNYESFAEHIAWLASSGCHGATPNGSLGEYQMLTPQERARVVTTAIQAAPEGFTVMPGVAAYGSYDAQRWTEAAAEAGAPAVMLLPPKAYRADRVSVVAHYRAVAEVGLPIVAYNNPHDTKVDLTPELLAEVWSEGLIVSVKEFSGDVRRPLPDRRTRPGAGRTLWNRQPRAGTGHCWRAGLGFGRSQRFPARLSPAVGGSPHR